MWTRMTKSDHAIDDDDPDDEYDDCDDCDD
jgi:hypothetical protein